VPEPPLIQWAIEKLSPRHDRAAFDCGKAPLNDFLRKYAGQNADLGISQTYVAVRPGSQRVDGYHSVLSGAVESANLPEAARRHLPRYPVPVAHLARLAVDLSAQGRGLGRLLLLDALERVMQAAESIGIHGIEVWAKDDQARNFYLKYGFVPLLDDPQHLYLGIRTARKLGLVR
jgi:ribosomal protein S18 acetylase RimI-like enzyme